MFKKNSFILLSLLILALVGCGDNKKETTKEVAHEEAGETGVVSLTKAQVELMKIEVRSPDRRQLEGYISAPAKVEPLPTRIADIGTLISGRVRNIYVAEGVRVEKGQVLLEIQGLEIGEIKGEYIRSRAALESARANFERQKKLLQENIAAKRAYIEAQATYAEARAAFSAADQKLHSIGIADEEAQSLLQVATAQDSHKSSAVAATLKIRSPISGVVGRTNVNLGQQVAPDTDIMEVVDSEKVWVVADIYEKNLASIKSGQPVEVITEAYPGLSFKGTLEFMSPVVDPETRTVKVRTTIDNRDGYLKPDMYANMRIFDDSNQQSLVIPEAAVQNDGEIDFVFVLVEDSDEPNHNSGSDHTGDNEHAKRLKFRKVPVQTGVQQDGFTEIVAGLEAKEKVVVNGAFFLKSEMMKENFGEHGH